MKYTLKEIAAIMGGTFTGKDSAVCAVVTDSRVANVPSRSLFVAIKGANHDGHAHIGELYGRGVRAFITDGTVESGKYPDAGFIAAVDSLGALQKLAAHHRRQFKGAVVGVTGSNGKTVVKEWIAQLAPQGVKVFRSPKSYNSQLGVPLSVLMLEGDEDIAVIEAGISMPGEMERLRDIIAPDIGVFTYLGEAHQENFTDKESKLLEKLKLFENSHTIIHNGSDHPVADSMDRLFGGRKLIEAAAGGYDLQNFPVRDGASVNNINLAIAVHDALGHDLGEVMQKVPMVQGVAMRMELKEGLNGSVIVNDSYNSDINSLAIALDYLSTVAASRERVLVLSDILQSGRPAGELYAQVGRLVKEKGVDLFIGIGEEIARHPEFFECEKQFYPSTEDFLALYRRSLFAGKAILLKGSRRFRFEKISRALEKKVHTTVLEVNLDNMIHNLNYFRSLLSPEVKVMAMVKALGYGSGAYEVANMLQNQGVAYLAVAFADEGVALREAGITMPVVVLNADSDSFDIMIENDLEPEIYNFTSLHAFTEAVKRQGVSNYPVHIKLDTGMHRLGFEKQDIGKLIDELREQASLSVRSVFSHLSASDESRHDEFTRSQLKSFGEMSGRITEAFPEQKILRHTGNSAAIERFPEAQFDMVRLGIGLYGIGVEHQDKLLPVSTLKSRIVQIKNLHAGETVGYGRHGRVDRETAIATVPIGYADGLDRHLSRGNWAFTVNGKKAPVIGNICMDTCMIDITGIKASEGDEAIVFGENPTVTEMAARLGTIPYEILTAVSARVKRVYIKE